MLRTRKRGNECNEFEKEIINAKKLSRLKNWNHFGTKKNKFKRNNEKVKRTYANNEPKMFEYITIKEIIKI